jgi:GNAT superfamily N-acetyltransferase
MGKKIQFKIRKAEKRDVPHILSFVKELAEYEKISHEVLATEDLYIKYGFGSSPFFHTLIVENCSGDELNFLGFALYFFTFSTFTGRPTLYLEDVFVLPEFRGHGIGKALLQYLANIALREDCGRMEWAVLDWNQIAIDFYLSINAKPMNDWTVYRLELNAIKKLAERSL